MKTNYFFLSLLFTPVLFFAQQLNSKINHVTVFMQGAQIERVATVEVQPGISTITLKGLSRYIDQNSIQAKITGVKILNISHQLDYLSDEEQNLDKRKLEAALKELDYKLKSLRDKKLNAEQELKLIEKNTDIKGQAVLDIADLEDFLIFYRSHLPLIRSSILNTEVSISTTEQEIQKVKQELRELNNSQQNVSATITLELSATTKSTKELSINYFVRNAGWIPTYNLRAKSINDPVSMEFNANVYQNTGVEWKNVSLTLATGNPQSSGSAPNLYPWYVDYYRQQYTLQNRSKEGKFAQDEMLLEAPVAALSKSNNLAPAAVVQSENLTFREYKITTPYNISSNGKQQRVEIQVHELPATYNYFAVPKMNNKAYLIAKVSNWEKYNLLSGNSKVYFEDTYVGEAYIDVNTTEDTLVLSLGEDKAVVIERTSILEKTSKNFIGSKETKAIAFEISVKNTKNKPIKIEVLDQIPVSKQAEIKVELKESNNAVHSLETGELKWTINIQPTELVTKQLEYEITYPKNKKINF